MWLRDLAPGFTACSSWWKLLPPVTEQPPHRLGWSVGFGVRGDCEWPMVLFSPLWGPPSPSPGLDRPLGKGTGARRGGAPSQPAAYGEAPPGSPGDLDREAPPGSPSGLAGSPVPLAVHLAGNVSP